ncbi:HlyD family efflux transporter periplasmic adaptor subunit [Seongchinamella unica]|uniref:HlyD family efflux transporter periplasmic adaptor subunit n=1 Tax=Seongchinamella unica TaxID=2547392 RepID=A0A4R5LUW0_9GAMM|nr:site-2 protease family protein [Seongchinamella unica]TDG15219.1 HlyD family efflux transporter periplasmic adaptor subunit [Seongchinamella unica]
MALVAVSSSGAGLFSGSWQQISQLQPRIPSHIRIRRHRYRGDDWYVIQDRATGKTHRFTPQAYTIIAMMNGRRTVHQLWEEALVNLGADAPSQDEVIQLLYQLYNADALQTDAIPDTDELVQRQRQQRQRQMLQRWRSPLAIRIPLFDPDPVIDRLMPVVNPLLGRAGFAFWLLTVLAGLTLAVMHWEELTGNVTDRVLMPSNLVLLGVVYPIVKAFHEFGHGIMARKWGAEVHEMGVMLLVFFPVPYVDASASAAFPGRWQRISVSSAGIFIELFLASVALFFWLAMESGMLSAIAYNVILIGGVSTVLINGNPLLRFDGYYILSDLLEIPNLGSRANKQVFYLLQRYLLRIDSARSPVTARGEKFWLPFYAVASFFYRMFIIMAIALFVAGKYFFVGVLLAVWVLTSVFLLPLVKSLWYLLTSSRIRGNRGRAIFASLLALAVVAGLLSLPAPSWTRSEGIVWLPDEAFVRVRSPGYVSDVVIESGQSVRAGDVLIESSNEKLNLEITLLESRIEELEMLRQQNRVTDLVKADLVDKQLTALREEFESALERRAWLSIRSEVDGRFFMPTPQDLPGRYLRRGDMIGYVIPQARPKVRAVVSQDRIGLVRESTREVKLLMANDPSSEVRATIIREVPEATTELPSLALSVAGGGRVAIDPEARDRARSYMPYFVFDLSPQQEVDERWYGQRVHVRFEHGLEPLALQIYRSARQLFLSKFNV